ncbi:hypothetical protein Arad_8508 [Rhizobium rhizogenes K84]|uniref:Uncharacterized protein n=1 Tax=Rhizobium rhizogenes (strain K84 / ATCC BAA-868) TaxID=311403 RepID=B9JIM0_RHIR8|nr:hypothetical protein Arad_8508 [Rhizobium rhizogenes K84]
MGCTPGAVLEAKKSPPSDEETTGLMMISSQLIRVVSSVGRRSFGLLSFG